MSQVIDWGKIISGAVGIPEPLFGFSMCALGFLILVYFYNQAKKQEVEKQK